MPTFTVIKNHFHENSLVIQTQVTAGKLLIDLKQGGSFRPRDKYTIEIHDGHIYHPVAKHINHSCEPNSFVNQETASIIALKELAHSDHITLDYYKTESIITVPFECSCGTTDCKGYVGTQSK